MFNSKNMASMGQNITGCLAVILVSVFITVGCANNKSPVTSGIGTSAMIQGDDFSKHLEVQNADLAKKNSD